MKIQHIIPAALTVLGLSIGNAHAITHKGVIESFDASSNQLTIVKSNGIRKSFTLSEDTKVWLEGEQASADFLKEHQTVELVMPESQINYVEGEILDVDQNAMTATIKQKGAKGVTVVQFAKDVSVKGKVSEFENLEKGHVVKLRFASK